MRRRARPLGFLPERGRGGGIARSDDIEAPFEIRPLAIPIYVEAHLGRRRDTRSPDEVRGYALAIGWRPFEATATAGFQRPEPPEISYLVADPQRPRPVWVPEGTVVKHFRTFLSGVPEPQGATEPAR